MTDPTTRIEHDAFGPVPIPQDRYWGAKTARALAVFEVGQERFPACLIHAFDLQKIAAVRANRCLGVLDPVIADAIVAAASDVREGRLDDHFPLTVWQTGSGTQTNMNVNEVAANVADALLLATALNPVLGYDRVAAITRKAMGDPHDAPGARAGDARRNDQE